MIWFRFPLYLSSKEAEKIQKKFDADEEDWKQRRDKEASADKSGTRDEKARDAYLANYYKSVAVFYHEIGMTKL